MARALRAIVAEIHQIPPDYRAQKCSVAFPASQITEGDALSGTGMSVRRDV